MFVTHLVEARFYQCGVGVQLVVDPALGQSSLQVVVEEQGVQDHLRVARRGIMLKKECVVHGYGCVFLGRHSPRLCRWVSWCPQLLL